MAKSQNTVGRTSAIVQPIIESLGLRLWDVEFIKEGAYYYLRIIIDKDEAVTIEDCEAVSRKIDKIIDDEDYIEQSYFLEVSSPGIERELKKQSHFDVSLGKIVKIRLIRALPDIDIGRDINGELVSVDKEKIVISCEEKPLEISRKNVAYVKIFCEELE